MTKKKNRRVEEQKKQATTIFRICNVPRHIANADLANMFKNAPFPAGDNEKEKQIK